MHPAAPIRTVLFDFDGTLVDHFTAIYRSYCYALEQFGMQPASYATVRATVGGSVPITMRKLVGEEKAEEATRHFREYFQTIMFEDLHVLPGVPWLLEELHEAGLTLAVFTNKQGDASRAIMEHLKLDHYFTGNFGSNDTPWKKPDPEFSHYALEKLGADPASTILVGDSPYDIAAAEAGGFDAYVVATGSHTAEELAVCDPAPRAVYADMHALGGDLFNFQRAES